MKLMVEGKLTKAGLYLFGNNCPLVYKAVEYPTTERLNTIDLKRFEGNVFQLINQVNSFINQKMSWRVEIDGVQRTEKPEIPVVAIREIVINSLVHCDYYADSEHQISIDPENIEIYNPGSFGEFTPIDYVEKILPSRTKHKVIQGVIFKAFYVETLGRGLKRMDNACKEYNIGWDYCKYNFGFSFIFKRPSSIHRTKFENLTPCATLLFNYMKDNNGILENIKLAMSVLNKKERAAYNVICELINNKLIERVGSNKTGYWRIIK